MCLLSRAFVVWEKIQQEFVFEEKKVCVRVHARAFIFYICTCVGAKRQRQGSLCIIVLVLSPLQDKVRAVQCVCVRVW